jgi:hypothetical protein
LILDGYVVAVDTSPASRDDLVGKIVVAWNPKEKALLLSRLIRFDHTEALVSDQRGHQSVLLGNGSHWRIVGGYCGGREETTLRSAVLVPSSPSTLKTVQLDGQNSFLIFGNEGIYHYRHR